jgi:hypothetical protein
VRFSSMLTLCSRCCHRASQHAAQHQQLCIIAYTLHSPMLLHVAPTAANSHMRARSPAPSSAHSPASDMRALHRQMLARNACATPPNACVTCMHYIAKAHLPTGARCGARVATIPARLPPNVSCRGYRCCCCCCDGRACRSNDDDGSGPYTDDDLLFHVFFCVMVVIAVLRQVGAAIASCCTPR